MYFNINSLLVGLYILHRKIIYYINDFHTFCTFAFNRYNDDSVHRPWLIIAPMEKNLLLLC